MSYITHDNIIQKITMQKYKNHPSISIIKKMASTVDKNNKFSIKPITADDISQQIKRLVRLHKKVIYLQS